VNTHTERESVMCLASAVGFLLLTVAFLACGIGFLAPYWVFFPGDVADDVVLDKARTYVGDKSISYDGMLGRCFAKSGCVFFFQNDFEMEKEVKGTTSDQLSAPHVLYQKPVFASVEASLSASGTDSLSSVFLDTGNPVHFFGFYARQLYRQVLLRARISYGNSVCLPSVLVSRPGTESSPGEIETPDFHVGSLVSNEVIWCRWVKRLPSNEGVKEGYPPKKS